LNALREQRRILTELISDEEITEATALKLREAINFSN
jgi:plasmid maintenance system antidote protein VapI